MAETAECATTTETKKIINPRVEIDTSPPFESVKEAVDRFGGSGPWIPHHLLRLAAVHHDNEAFDMEKIEEQAVQLERDLIIREKQTLNVLKEVEAAKRLVEGLKVNLMPDMSSFMGSPNRKLEDHVTVPYEHSSERVSFCPALSPGLMFTELNQAKLNLNKTSVDLAAIQASVECLNKKLRKDKVLLEMRSKMQIQNSKEVLPLEENHHKSMRKPDVQQKVETVDSCDISMTLSREIRPVNFEAEQFKKMTEASRYEVMKAMTEIERTKNCIRMAEMRLNAAKKMEEAAKAVEAIALAERKALLNGENSSDDFVHKPDGITLSFQEYQALSQKAKQAEELCKTKFIDTNGLQRTNDAHQLEVPILEKFEETITEDEQSQQVVSLNEGRPHHTNVVIEDSFSRTHTEHGRMQRSGNNSAKFKFRNSHAGNRNPDTLNGNESCATKDKPCPGFRSTTSIGDVLSRKIILQDDLTMGKHVENHSERQHVSLSEMLRKQSRLILHPTKTTADGNVEKQYFIQRKKFGFIQLPIPTKQSKKKAQPLNLR